MERETWRLARRRARDKALERGERPSGERGSCWRIGMEILRALKRIRDEHVDSTFILSVSSLKAPTSSTTILPPAASGALAVAEVFTAGVFRRR